MAKPLRCRLRLHAWEDRENPELITPQVCARFKAFRYAQVGRTAKWPPVARGSSLQLPRCVQRTTAANGHVPAQLTQQHLPPIDCQSVWLHGVCNEWETLEDLP